MQCQGVQLLWQGKHYMIVRAWQQVCLPLIYPLFPLMPLALRAMPVPATVIADADSATFITGVHMTAKSGCSALHYSPKGLVLMNC